MSELFTRPDWFARQRRRLKFWWQRRTRGWDDSDTWCLDAVIARFALPRLKRFRALRNGHPIGLTDAEWELELAEIEWLLEQHASDDGTWEADPDRFRKACISFGQGFGHLWW